MATLESGFNSTYSKNASILTGNPNRVTVEVEDSIDRDFWKDLLRELCPDKDFHFDPYCTIVGNDGREEKHGNGKSRVLNDSSSFNAWHIGCVDSDYDWILSDFSSEGKIIRDSKYLLQTYAYSIENLMCLSCTLKDFCSDVTEETADFDFIEYMSRLSKVLYPLLVWSLYLCSKGIDSFTSSSMREVLVNTEKDAEQSLTQVEAKVKTKIEELNHKYADDIDDKASFEHTMIATKNLSDDTAYLYVRGHDLFDHLLTSVLNPIISNLRSSHYEALRSLDEKIRTTALQEYRKKEKSVRYLLQKNYRYKNQSFLFDKIRKDVSQIWK